MTTTYVLGIDVGTTFTAAAIHRDGQTEVASLGSRSLSMPTTVFHRDGDGLLIGEAAVRRGSDGPERLAREFKRRVGDTTPIMLGGVPYSAERLVAAVLREVIRTVAVREGGEAAHVAVSHPANWGPYKLDLMQQAVELAGVPDATLVAEPIAAAIQYAATERIALGATVGVYDLGGGTFDAAVLRRTHSESFEILGQPSGIERLGGIDFDAAVLAHVQRTLGDGWAALDASDPAVRIATERLRQECVAAKEALSFDTDTTVAVMLPGLTTELRITRSEFEAMIRAPILETVSVLQRTIEQAGVAASDLSAVLLVGGSSRIPLVGESVAAELGRAIVSIDAHPKHTIALGAARTATAGAAAAAGSTDTVDDGSTDGAPAPHVAPRQGRMWRRLALGVGVAALAAGIGVALAAPRLLQPTDTAATAAPHTEATPRPERSAPPTPEPSTRPSSEPSPTSEEEPVAESEPPDEPPVSVPVISDELVFTLRWSDESFAEESFADLDLVVIEPDGTKVWHDAPGPTGTSGRLRGDANSGCASSESLERVSWPVGRAPVGVYRVQVINNSHGCGDGARRPVGPGFWAHYELTVSVPGGAVMTGVVEEPGDLDTWTVTAYEATDDAIVLTGHGLEPSLALPMPAGDAEAAFRGRFGPADFDSGWQDAAGLQEAGCFAAMYRVVGWGDPAPTGPVYDGMSGWLLRDADSHDPGDWLLGLVLATTDSNFDAHGITTPRGIGLGATRAEIEAAYGQDAEFTVDSFGDARVALRDNDEEIVGFLTEIEGLDDEKRLMMLSIGETCGADGG